MLSPCFCIYDPVMNQPSETFCPPWISRCPPLSQGLHTSCSVLTSHDCVMAQVHARDPGRRQTCVTLTSKYQAVCIQTGIHMLLLLLRGHAYCTLWRVSARYSELHERQGCHLHSHSRRSCFLEGKLCFHLGDPSLRLHLY